MKRNLRITEVREAFVSDQRFRDLFPEMKHAFDDYLKNKKCPSCLMDLVKELLKYKERLAIYFPDRDI